MTLSFKTQLVMNSKLIKSILLLCTVIASTAFIIKNKNASSNTDYTFKSGDIIYQSSDYQQSKAIKLATHSKYSHVGLVIVNERKETMVLEAVQPVQMIPIKTWIERNPEKEFCLQRLKTNLDVHNNKSQLDSMSKALIGKNYDLLFVWSNEKFYCSELVWKIYNEVFDIQLSTLKQLKDFDLNDPFVKKILTQRYGANIPYTQNVVAPQDLYESSLLSTVYEGVLK